jgi:hypothetical protein
MGVGITMLRRVHHGDAGALSVSRAGFETIASLSLWRGPGFKYSVESGTPRLI